MAEPAFGVQLRNARKRRGVSLRALASELGIAVAYLHDVEHSRRAPLRRGMIVQAVDILHAHGDMALREHNETVRRLLAVARDEIITRALRKWERDE